MENDPSIDPRIVRLLELKRLERPPLGFPDYLRGRVMRAIAAERARAQQPWWNRFVEEVTWQRGLLAANTLALAGVAFLAAATFQVAHSVANEDVEGQVYAALPLPQDMASRNNNATAAASQTHALLAANEESAAYRPLPTSGVAASINPTFSLPPASVGGDPDSTPKWLFNTPSASNPRFILVSDRGR